LRAAPASGIPTLSVEFDYAFRSGAAIANLSMDFDGDGSFDQVTSYPTDSVESSYSRPGLYFPRFRAADANGNSSEAIVAVCVLETAAIDARIKQVWNAMNAALVAGDMDEALEFLTARSQQKYGPAFDALLPYVPEIVASYSPIHGVSIFEDLAEYAVNRTIDGEDRVFFIYFVRDQDGLWRLDSM